ncbi:MAG TPA: dihydropteroate synthase [Clostridiaceae bacterium]|nr:dihydropteroate synthase [Clostridiaceae bacterium]
MLQDHIIKRRAQLRETLGKELLVFDGAMGSQLHIKGIRPGERPEDANIDHAEWIVDIHSEYLESGANCILTNTLGANRYHLEDSSYSVKEVIDAAISNAHKAIEIEKARCNRLGIHRNTYMFYNIGPIGQLLQPMGTLSFDEAYSLFKDQVLIAKDQADAVLIETMSDTLEIKAAILAIKENSDLPIFASMTFDENQRTLTGASPLTAVTILEGLGVDCLGVNCSLGPKELEPIVMEILSIATIPVIVEPNAGLPVYANNQTTYNVSMEEFAKYIKRFVDAGVSCFGGCCGTTPEYIRQCLSLIEDRTVARRSVRKKTRVASGIDCVTLGEKTIVCGERLNPTGKKKLKEALLAQRIDAVLQEGLSQVKAGAHILDVNVGVPGIDEAVTMKKVVYALQEVLSVPLQIDSSSPLVLEQACRQYNGKPLINSVNGKVAVMDEVFPIVKKYGGVVIGLTLDEDGIPETTEKRIEIAKRIVDCAEKYGIDRSDIVIDCLCLTVSAQQDAADKTLEAITYMTREMGLCTVLGLSNISFGLPNRLLINQAYLLMALQAGLSMPIMNPLEKPLMDSIDAFEVLSGHDVASSVYVDKHAADQVHIAGSQHIAKTSIELEARIDDEDSSLTQIIVAGRKGAAVDRVRFELVKSDPMQIINEQIIPALGEVGNRYEKGTIFLPQLISSAETAKLAFVEINNEIAKSSTGPKRGPVVIATVEGDVHDIGKNIVKVVLESYGFDVVDLGKDVPVQRVVEAFKTYHPKLIGLSALMTTTVVYMDATIKALKKEGCDCPIMVGGAVLTADVARDVGADYYAKDAMESAAIATRIIPE